jgi:hypothetical protein
MRRILVVLAVILGTITTGLVLPPLIAGANPPNDCYTNGSTGNDGNPGTSGSPKATIQACIGAVNPGGTVYVAAGTYDESLSIGQSVILEGANAGVSGTGARGPETIINPSPNDGTAGVFNITTSDPVTIDGFQSTYVGTDAGGQQATGGLVLSTQAGNQLTFEDNVVTGSQFNNALIFDDGASSSTITDNLFTGTTQYHDNGTGIIGAWGSPSQQAVVTITGNTFNGLTEIPSSPGNPNGTPVLNINDDGGTISGNTFSDLHEYGILLADKLADLDITGNTFTGIYNDTPASSSNRGSGVRLFTADDSLDIAGPVNVDLNTFTNMYHAVDVANDGFGADLTSGNLHVERNSFIGPFTGAGTGVGSTNSTAVNVASGTVGTLDATCNWWGGIPTPNQYAGSVTVSPYLFAASPLATTACGVNTNTALITSAPSVQVAFGRTVKFTVTTHGNPPATLSVVGLPAGLSFTPGTKSRAGTAKLTGGGLAGGDHTFTIHANNGVGPDTTQVFTVHVLAFTSPAGASFSKSGPPTQAFTITTTGAGAGVDLTSTLGTKQSGLTFQDNGNGTATISGTAAAKDRTGTIKVTAKSGAATATQKLAIGITP